MIIGLQVLRRRHVPHFSPPHLHSGDGPPPDLCSRDPRSSRVAMPITGHDANFLRRAVQTHRRKIQSLYKRAVRNLESWENFNR